LLDEIDRLAARYDLKIYRWEVSMAEWGGGI
jgi:hypothetical protein